MGVRVIIKRTVKQGHQARELVPLLLEMRCIAARQPGYISGETLCDTENPGDCLDLSNPIGGLGALWDAGGFCGTKCL